MSAIETPFGTVGADVRVRPDLDTAYISVWRVPRDVIDAVAEVVSGATWHEWTEDEISHRALQLPAHDNCEVTLFQQVVTDA